MARHSNMIILSSAVAQALGRFLGFVRRENLLRLAGVIALLIVGGTAGLAYFEGRSVPDALWWSVVTLTTVGFGDISPVSLGGRLIGVVLMFFGIGVLGMFTATIAGVFVEQRIRKDRGMESCTFENHIILCGWNGRMKDILADLRADARSADRDIALVADIDAKPVPDDHLHFVRGDVTEENLKRAGIESAATVVIVGDRSLDYSARDAKTVLSTLTVESLNPDVYSIVELATEANVRHCQRAGADEIVVGAELCSRVMSTAAHDHGISTVLRELLSAQVGQDLVTVPVPSALAGRPFFDVFSALKREHDKIAVAIQRQGNGAIETNPGADSVVAAADRLVVISARERRASAAN
jgi:voltage-gated potassium channel